MTDGEIVSHEKIRIIASDGELLAGRVTLNHPRNGRVCIERSPSDGVWRVTSISRPDVVGSVKCVSCGHVDGRHLQSCPKAPWR